jgi:hypothetical protein
MATINNPGIVSTTFDSSRVGENVRFNPGHYLAVIRNSTTGLIVSWTNILTVELPACATIRGVQARYTWADLEPTEGNYDFSRITAELNDLAAVSGGARRLAIMIETKNFVLTYNVAPAWLMSDPIYGGGQFEYDAGPSHADGYIIRLDNDYVKDKFLLLIQALGAYLKNETLVEMFAFPEAVIPTGASITVDYTKHFAALIAAATAAKSAFPKTIIKMILNYIPPYTEDNSAAFAASMDSAGLQGFGWPNTMEDEANFRKVTPYTGNYILAEARMSSMVICPEVQTPDFVYSNFALTGGYTTSPQLILDYLKLTFNPQYIFWSRDANINAVSGNKNFDDVYTLLNLAPQTADIWGGLNKTRPTSIS